MTDLNEQDLARDLHLRPLPAERTDIAQRSIALGRQMRRRRRAGVVTVLAALVLVVGVALGGGNQFGRLEPPPADSPAPSGPDIPTLVPIHLTPGPAPTVDYVVNGTWIRADGRRMPLTDPASLVTDEDRGDGFVRFAGGLLAIRDLNDGPGSSLGYSRDNGPPTAIPGVDSRVLGGPQAGPDGSVLIPVVGGYAVAHIDGTWSVEKRFGDPAATDAPPGNRAADPSVAALKDAVFHAVRKGSTTVVRRSALDPNVEIVDHEGWTRPVTSDIAGDRIVLADGKGCQEVRRQNGWLGSWATCSWDVRTLAGDGHHVVAFNTEFAWAVVNMRTGRPVLVLGDAVRADSFRFDRSGQLNVVVKSHDGQSAIATCALDGRCWLATHWTPLEYMLVKPNDS